MDNRSYSGPQYDGVVTQPGAQQPQTVKIPEPNKGNAETFKKYALVSLIFSIVYTFCLYKNHSGITYPFFMAITLGLLYVIRKKDGLTLLSSRNERKLLGYFYIVALMALSIHRCLTTSWSLLFLDALAIWLLFFSYVLYLYVDTTGWDILSWIEGLVCSVVLPISHSLQPFADYNNWMKNRNGEMDSKKKQNLKAVFIGVLCSIPLLIVVISLLCSADAMFSELLDTIAESIHLPDNIWDIFGILITLIVSFWAAYLVPDVLSRGEVKVSTRGEGKENPIIAITITGILGVVYLAFCVIQVLYLFTGSMSLPSGYTYAEYAHEGFYQLLAVCLINLALVSVCNRLFKSSKVLTGILVAIAGFTYIMIASSAMRMLLYIGVYHLTFLRMFVLWFLGVLCLWLAFLMVSLFNKNFPVFRACMVAISIAYVGFAFANPEYRIAKYDLDAAGIKVDEYQSVQDYILSGLSTDAVPALVDDEDTLHQYRLRMISQERYEGEKHDSIRTYNISYARAQKYFKLDKK